MSVSDGALLCGVCRHRLGTDEARTCRACVADTRAHLGAIEHAYALLPDLLVGLGSNAPQPGRTASNERPMPGGDVLVLLGPGSPALERVRAWLRDPDRDPDFDQDDRPGDPPSAAYALGRHEDDWRHVRREPAAAAAHTVAGAVAYLHGHLTWAAARHPGFAEFALDLAALRRRLEVAAQLDDRPERAGVACFGCGDDLQRPYGHNGREDDWTCRRCRRVYDQAAYLLAVRATLQEVE